MPAGSLLNALKPAWNQLTNAEMIDRYQYTPGNRLSGPIPPELGNLASLETLDLAWNQLTDPIPAELGQLTSLKRLSLATNQLEGAIPAELAELPNLSYLNLSRNKLTGSVPAALCRQTTLDTLNLSHNQLNITEEVGNCQVAKVSLQANSRSPNLLWPWLLRGGFFAGAVFCLHQLRKKPVLSR